MNTKIIMLSAFFSAGLFAAGIDESNSLTKLDGADKPHLMAPSTSTTLLDCEWLACDGKKYLAVAGINGDDGSGLDKNIRIFEFNPFAETLIKAMLSDVFHGARLNALSWLVCGDKKYLASAGLTGDDALGDGSQTVRVYQFNPNTQELTKVNGNVEYNATVQAIDWLVCEDTKYLAAGGANDNGEIHLFTFDKTLQTLAEQASGRVVVGSQVNSISWCVTGERKLLAMGGSAGTGGFELRVLELNTITNAFTILATANKIHGATVQSVDWVDCGGKKYLAIGGNTATGPVNVRVYEFDSTANTLIEVEAARTSHETTVFEVKWLNCGDKKYLGIIGNESNDAKEVALRVYKFDQDAGTLTQVFEYKHGESGFDDLSGSLAWLQCGGLTYLAAVGEQSDDGTNAATRVFRVNFDQDATNKLLREKYFQLHGNNAPEASQKA